jgi:histidinol phosphatase-like PHP family hydrolase
MRSSENSSLASLRRAKTPPGVWSDGHSTPAEMAEAAKARGYEYLLITDHSAGLPIANGLSEARFCEQWRELNEVSSSPSDIWRPCATPGSISSAIHYVTFALGAVTRAGIPSDRVINCLSADDLTAWARSHRRRTPSPR